MELKIEIGKSHDEHVEYAIIYIHNLATRLLHKYYHSIANRSMNSGITNKSIISQVNSVALIKQKIMNSYKHFLPSGFDY